ncbi:MAG: NYN domain-containing protein [Promethearchaeota archaeon]
MNSTREYVKEQTNIMPKEKLCIFIDGGNVFHAANSLKIHIDLAKLVAALTGNRTLTRTYYYGATLNTPTQQRFFDKLRHLGFTVKTLPLRQYDRIPFEKGIDVMLVTDMLTLAHNNTYDIALLVSGDKDFTYTLQELKTLGKTVEVAAFTHALASELQQAADNTILLDHLIPNITLLK